MLHAPDPRLTVHIEGVDDPRLAAVIEQAVRSAFWRVRGPSQWVVSIAPADQRGRWAVGVKGRIGRYLFSVDGPAAYLPDLIRERVADAFDQLR